MGFSLIDCDNLPFFSSRILKKKEINFSPMKRIKDKFKRSVKYLRVSYQQASGRERLSLGMFVLMMLTYVWWTMLAL